MHAGGNIPAKFIGFCYVSMPKGVWQINYSDNSSFRIIYGPMHALRACLFLSPACMHVARYIMCVNNVIKIGN